MKTDKLIDAIGMIKDEYINEAHEKTKRQFVFPWQLIGKLAVAGLSLLLIVNIFPAMFNSYNSHSSGATSSTDEYNSYVYDDEGYSYNSLAPEVKESYSEGNSNSGANEEKQTLKDPNKKLILTANMNLETKDLDNTVDKILTLVEKYGGYVQQSSIYSRTSQSRTYDASIRIPADSYTKFLEEIKVEGNTVSYSEKVDDITDSYTDISARLESLKAQESKVMEFYQKANTIEDLMAVESRLSDLRYQIEYYEAQIKNYDLLVAYSTLNITVSETITYTPSNPSFFSRLASAFTNGFSNFVNAIGDLIIDIVYNIWTILFLVVIVFVGYHLYKFIRRKIKK